MSALDDDPPPQAAQVPSATLLRVVCVRVSVAHRNCRLCPVGVCAAKRGALKKETLPPPLGCPRLLVCPSDERPRSGSPALLVEFDLSLAHFAGRLTPSSNRNQLNIYWRTELVPRPARCVSCAPSAAPGASADRGRLASSGPLALICRLGLTGEGSCGTIIGARQKLRQQ